MARRRVARRKVVRKRRSNRRRKVVKGRRLGKREYGGYVPTELIDKLKTAAGVAALLGGGGSTTTTETKKEWTENTEDGVKFMHVKINYKASKKQKTTKALSQVGQVYGFANGGQTSGSGVQNGLTVVDFNHNDINSLHFALNDGVGTSALRQNEFLNFIGSTDEIEFLNCSPASMEFDIYILIDKITATTRLDAGVVWQDGIAEESNDAVAPTEVFTNPWNKPTDYKAFRMAFWSRRKHCVLGPGEKCKFTLTFNRNRLLDTSYIANYDSIRGITHRIYVVQRGTVIDSTNLKTIALNGQSLSETKLVYIRKQTAKGSILSTLPKVTKHMVLTGGMVSGDFPVLANAWHIDPETGEPEDTAVTTEFA